MMTTMNSVIRVVFSSAPFGIRKLNCGTLPATHGRAFVSQSVSLLLMLVGALSCVGCSNEPEPEANIGLGEQQQTIRDDVDTQTVDSDAESVTVEQQAPPADSQPPVKLTAREFLDAKANENLGQYSNRWLELTARIYDLTVRKRDGGNHALFATLQPLTDKEGKPTKSHHVEFLSLILDDPEPWKKASVGSTATMRCRLTDNYFSFGSIESAEGEPGIEITAEEFAAALDSDAEQAKKRYHKKTLILTGTVSATDGMGKTVGYADVGILLKGNDQNPVGIHFTTFENSQFKSLKPGDTVKVIGKGVVSPDASDEELKLGLEFSSRLDLRSK